MAKLNGLGSILMTLGSCYFESVPPFLRLFPDAGLEHHLMS